MAMSIAKKARRLRGRAAGDAEQMAVIISNVLWGVADSRGALSRPSDRGWRHSIQGDGVQANI
jgi:hypothetical protein